jgi:hypothetical protein
MCQLGFHFLIQTSGMFTVARCTRAAVWIRATGLADFASEVEDPPWTALGTLPNPVVTAGGNRLSLGMECCWTHSLACSQVTELDHRTSAVSVRRETQGTSKPAHGGGGGGGGVDAVCAAILRTDIGVLSAFLDLCCQTRSGAILRAHTAAGSMAGRISAGYRDSRATTCRQARQIYVWPRGGTVRGEAAVQHEWKEVD